MTHVLNFPEKKPARVAALNTRVCLLVSLISSGLKGRSELLRTRVITPIFHVKRRFYDNEETFLAKQTYLPAHASKLAEIFSTG